MGAWPMCVWTQKDATPAPIGSAHARPQVIAQVRKTNNPNGSTVM